ncbi:hypothetical protein EN985_10875 [Mesorhizobium sp. M7A.F.Ca.CA.004.04.1.1]|nr:hypothetical protein EN985_10875 [Mesorhizobium sp. M7A.F.Ca.CA.004.04.1.1]
MAGRGWGSDQGEDAAIGVSERSLFAPRPAIGSAPCALDTLCYMNAGRAKARATAPRFRWFPRVPCPTRSSPVLPLRPPAICT